jgi:hypothetical protein
MHLGGHLTARLGRHRALKSSDAAPVPDGGTARGVASSAAGRRAPRLVVAHPRLATGGEAFGGARLRSVGRPRLAASRLSAFFAGDVSFSARGRLSRKRWATSACGRRLPRAPVACSEARRFHPLPLPPSKRVALGETLAFFRGRSGWPILQGGAFIGPCWRRACPCLAVSSETVGAGATRGRLSRKRWAATRGVGGRGEPRAPVACSDPRRLLPPLLRRSRLR